MDTNHVLVTVADNESNDSSTVTYSVLRDEYGRPLYGYPV